MSSSTEKREEEFRACIVAVAQATNDLLVRTFGAITEMSMSSEMTCNPYTGVPIAIAGAVLTATARRALCACNSNAQVVTEIRNLDMVSDSLLDAFVGNEQADAAERAAMVVACILSSLDISNRVRGQAP